MYFFFLNLEKILTLGDLSEPIFKASNNNDYMLLFWGAAHRCYTCITAYWGSLTPEQSHFHQQFVISLIPPSPGSVDSVALLPGR